jgi:outer membrane lipoprotein LolB
VTLTMPDGRTIEAADWEALTVRTLGAPVPVRGLASWVRGVAHRSTPHSVERDALGRASLLRQDGWEIVYAYAGESLRPLRLQLSYVDTELRLVIDNWDDAR